MKVKLLQNIVDPRTNKVKVVPKSGKRIIGYFADTVIEVSEETGKKWIQQGKAKLVP